jgi:HEPN domain-containing protein
VGSLSSPARRRKGSEGVSSAFARFGAGHSIKEILEHLAASLQVPATLLDASRELDKVYVTARYPSGFVSGTPSDYFTANNSEQPIRYARTILEFCRSQIH